MKRLLITLIVTVLSAQLMAQVQKGAILGGGNFSINLTNSEQEFSPFGNTFIADKTKFNFTALRPQLGIFVSESTLIGLGFNYEHNSRKTTNTFSGLTTDFKEKSNIYLINPYLTKYLPIAEKFYFTGTINFLIGFGNGLIEGNEEIKTSSFELRLNVRPGLTYFVSEKWALTGSIGQIFYNHTRTKPSSDEDNDDLKNVDNNYGLSASFNTFTIGFQYFLGTGGG